MTINIDYLLSIITWWSTSPIFYIHTDFVFSSCDCCWCFWRWCCCIGGTFRLIFFILGLIIFRNKVFISRLVCQYYWSLRAQLLGLFLIWETIPPRAGPIQNNQLSIGWMNHTFGCGFDALLDVAIKNQCILQ